MDPDNHNDDCFIYIVKLLYNVMLSDRYIVSCTVCVLH